MVARPWSVDWATGVVAVLGTHRWSRAASVFDLALAGLLVVGFLA